MFTKLLKLKFIQLSALLFRGLNYRDSAACLFVWFIGACLPLLLSQLIDITLLFFCSSFIFLITLFFRESRPKLLLLLFCVLGLMWTTYFFQKQLDSVLPHSLEKIDVAVIGLVQELPVEKDDVVNFIFKIESSESREIKANTLIKLSCYRCDLAFLPDQRWNLTVRLKRPHGYASWGAFDYEKYLFRHEFIAKGYVRKKGINLQLDSEVISVDQLRLKITQKLKTQSSLSNIGLSMMLALGVGDKSMLNSVQSRVFQEAGVSHIMAISGLHIGLVFIAISWLAKWLCYPIARCFVILPRQYLVLIPALASATLYAALAGFAVSTMRALVMLVVFVICRLSTRQVSLRKVLLVAVCVIVLFDPFSILDIGFWLSCGAVFIIALVSEGSKKISLVRLQPLLWLGMLPLSALFFGQVSLVSPLVNLVAVPVFCFLLIPLTLFSLCLLMLGMTGLSELLFTFLDAAFVFIFDYLQWLTTFSYTQIYTAPWSSWHASLILLLVVAYRLECIRWALGVGCILVLSLLVHTESLFFNRDEQLKVTLLDVGQGLSIVVQVNSQTNHTLVYDTGPSYPSGFSAANAVLLPFLRHEGINKIDKLVISHADNDHIGGYTDVVKNIEVAEVITSRVDVLSEATLCHKGQSWVFAGVHFDMISPDVNTPIGSNNLSCVLKIEFEGVSFLIAGDIEVPVERHLLNNESALKDLKSDVLVVPHHGSQTSSSAAFLDAVNPKTALVSAGYLNRYRHPHKTVIDRYVERDIDFLSTVDNGSVIIHVNKFGWSKLSYREKKKAFWHYQKKPN